MANAIDGAESGNGKPAAVASVPRHIVTTTTGRPSLSPDRGEWEAATLGVNLTPRPALLHPSAAG